MEILSPQYTAARMPGGVRLLSVFLRCANRHRFLLPVFAPRLEQRPVDSDGVLHELKDPVQQWNFANLGITRAARDRAHG